MNKKSMNVPPEIRSLILGAERILLICHIAPDGDAIGSLLGLGRALRKLGKACTYACADDVPSQFMFLPGAAEIGPARCEDHDLIITLDSSDLARIGSMYDPACFRRKPVINIDHHITNLEFAGTNWVERVAATAEMCLALVMALEIPLDPTIATCLLTGIVTDTRSFRTSTVTVEVLRRAVALVEAGASLADITEHVYQRNSLARICLWGQALSGVHIQDRIIWTEISAEMRRSCQASDRDGEGLVSFLDATRDADVAIVFQEKDGEAEASMRAARGVDVSGVALGLGGGGHPQAAGCTCKGTLAEVRDRVLAATRQALREQGRLA